MVTRQEIESAKLNANLTDEQINRIDTQVSSLGDEGLSNRTVRDEVPQAPQQPIQETPQPVQQAPEPELFSEPTAPVEPVQQPQEQAPVQQTPVEPVVTEIKTPSTPETPVQDAQQIKNDALANEASEKALAEQEKQQVTNDFNSKVASGASTQELAAFAAQNPQYADSFRDSIRSQFKDKANMNFFREYNGMSNESMYAAVKNGTIKVGSERYNSLPESQRLSFEAFKNAKDAPAGIPQKKDEIFDETTPENTVDFSNIESFISKMFSSDLRTKLDEARNDDRVVDLTTELNAKASELEKFDLDGIRASKKLADDLGNQGFSPAMIAATVRDDEANRSIIRLGKVSEYNRLQGNLQSIKDDIDSDLELFKFEDQQAKEKYGLLFDIYNSRRAEQRADASAIADREFQVEQTREEREYEEKRLEFVEENKKLAESRALENQKQLATFNQELSQNNLSGGKYIDDGEGNLNYVKNGETISVLKGLGENVSTSEDKNYTYQIKDNPDGTRTVFGLPKTGGNVFTKTYGIEGDEGESYVQGIGTGKITSYGGAHDRYEGLDIDGNIGDPISVPLAGTIVEATSHPAYGNNVIVEFSDGNRARYSHLDKGFGNIGDTFGKGTIIGTLGNTGNVLKLDGTKPNASELKAGFGSHLDLVTIDENGNTRSAKETEAYLSNIGNTPQSTPIIDDFAINKFNNSTFKPQDIKDPTIEVEYKEFLKQKAEVFGNKDASINDILKYSAGGKDLTDATTKPLEKFDTVINQLSDIQDQISNTDVGPIKGFLAGINPYNTDAQVLKAQLTSVIPGLARGVYGEVGVLTDNDIRLYSKTIPNLTSTEEVNEAVLALTLKVVAGGYKRQLQTLAASGKDVSGFTGLYDNLTSRVSEIENKYGINPTPNNEVEGVVTTPTGFQFDYTRGINQTKANNATYTSFFNQ